MVHIARWQVILILVICVLGLAFAAPNFLPETESEDLPGWVPHKQVNLGLDLQGGSHLLLEVEVQVVVREHMEALVDSTRRTLRPARIGFTGLGISGNTVQVTLRDPAQQDQARERLTNMLQQNFVTAAGGAMFGAVPTGPDFDFEISDDGRITMTLTEQALVAKRSAAVEQSIEVIRRRIDEFGTREPTIQRQGVDRILVQLPGVRDPERVKQLLGKTAKLTFRFVDESAGPSNVPPGSEVLTSEDGLQQYVVRKRVMVSGENLVDARPSFDQGLPVVAFRFDAIGARRFGDATSKNVGRLFAIVLDNQVISAPVIRSAILGGSGIITGGFTVESANDLAVLLRAGALPAPLTVLEERTVGPGLGQDSIDAGKIASLIGVILVVVFMMLVYGLFGLLANIALVINLSLLLACLSAFQATLTLPGIAGIVLTIGMAVDANVLIFERIREEVRLGRTPISAVDTGYRRAMTTIIDSNLTTLIAALLLFGFGTGPIKGFAVTLSIGIATSMFTAIMVTRLMVVTWLRRRRPQALPI
ncbi:MAG: protein translocase subunit SecD [Alphaproteobacteria bacterium]|nr:protein translocase subunit SecD [Alphaproteobacteria bacterium]